MYWRISYQQCKYEAFSNESWLISFHFQLIKRAADNCGPMCDCADSCFRLPMEKVRGRREEEEKFSDSILIRLNNSMAEIRTHVVTKNVGRNHSTKCSIMTYHLSHKFEPSSCIVCHIYCCQTLTSIWKLSLYHHHLLLLMHSQHTRTLHSRSRWLSSCRSMRVCQTWKSSNKSILDDEWTCQTLQSEFHFSSDAVQDWWRKSQFICSDSILFMSKIH